jgi:hypothetical protein
MASSSSWIRLLQRRPLLSSSVITVTGGLGVAGFIEWHSWEAERRYWESMNSSSKGDAVPHVTLLPREYNAQVIREYWTHRPLSAMARLGTVASELLPLAALYMRDFVLFPPTPPTHNEYDSSVEMTTAAQQQQQKTQLQKHHAVLWRQALTRLGPAFVKAGQQLSIRPDLVPPVVLKELQSLCDAVEPIADSLAMQVLCHELQIQNVHDLFADCHLVASASLGQVYQAKLNTTGETVAVKVQRPNMQHSFSLDLFWLQKVGVMLDKFTSVFTHQPPFHQALYESFAQGSYTELDYEQEARSQVRFQQELAQRHSPVRVPRVYPDYSSQRVLTTEWIEGIKLVDASPDQIRKLIPIGVELFLTQLLDIGAFHADPQ